MGRSSRRPGDGRTPCGAGPAEAGPVRQAILAILDALDGAILAKDAGALLALLEAEFVGVLPSGLVLSRGAYVVFHTRPEEGLIAIVPAPGDPPTVNLLAENVAVVHRRVSVQRVEANRELQAFDVQRIELMRATAGRWRLMSGQGTRVAGPAAGAGAGHGTPPS